MQRAQFVILQTRITQEISPWDIPLPLDMHAWEHK